ncbi:unnamed protein product [Oppiella nova]|uniref:Mif2/CENP-C cupin domain-containing protein n=1 Tax=Oppiella nova TaxID=334625 RepID=A0A7R9LL94_9ACAR|nr:unnamed protein product [Oppiella nova]CAG2164758.1 unnamed protein product [Oppiella nova]
MSGVTWNLDPLSRVRRPRSRPPLMHNIIRVKSYADIETISRATDAQPSVPHDFLSTIRRISDIHRKNGSRNSAPAVNFGAYMPNLSISSGDSDEDQTFLNCLKGIQTSTPQTASKRLPIAGPSCAPSSSSRRVANTSTPNVPLSLTKRSANKALKPLPNILMNQTLTPIGRSVESPKPSTVIRKSVNRSVKQKTPIHERTMRSVGRKSYIPEYLERTVLDSSPYGSPFTPMTIVKKKKKKSRNNKTINNTTAVNNTTLFNDTTATQMHRSFRSTTTQTNDSLRQMSDVCNQTFDVPIIDKTIDQSLTRMNDRYKSIERGRDMTAGIDTDVMPGLNLTGLELNESNGKQMAVGEAVNDVETMDNNVEDVEEDNEEDSEVEDELSNAIDVDNDIDDKDNDEEESEVEAEDNAEESEVEAEDNAEESEVEAEDNEEESEVEAEDNAEESEVEVEDNAEESEVEAEDNEEESEVEAESNAEESEVEAEVNEEESEVDVQDSEEESEVEAEDNAEESDVEDLEKDVEKDVVIEENNNIVEDLNTNVNEENKDIEDDNDVFIPLNDIEDENNDCGDVDNNAEEVNVVETAPNDIEDHSSDDEGIDNNDVEMVTNESDAEDVATGHEEQQIPDVESSKETVEENEGELRRSKRNRLQPLEFWRGERAVYKRDSSGITEKIVTVLEGSQEIRRVRTNNTKGIKRKLNFDEKRGKEINIFDLSIHKKVKTNKEKPNSNIKSFDDMVWKVSAQSEGVDIAIINKNRAKGDAIGMLRFQGMATKNKSRTGDYETHLCVTYGALLLKVDTSSSCVIKTGDNFTIKSNTNYSLSNLRKDIAYLSFTVLKD